MVESIFNILRTPVNFVWNWFESILNACGLYNFVIFSVIAFLCLMMFIPSIRGGSAGLSTRTLFRDRSEPSSRKDKKE